MKTKFLCLVLGIMMMLAVFTSCSNTEKTLDDMADNAVRETQTLVVYLMAEKEVSPQTEEDVEEAINKLTKSKYKTQLDLRFFTEENYYTALEKKFKDKETEIKKAEKELNDKRKIEKELRESCKAAGISYIPQTTPAPDTAITEAATLVNQEYGTIEYVYPEAGANQLDFFYVGDYNKYINYIDNEWAAALDEELSTSSKRLNEHIPAIYADHMNNGGIYGVPNNNVIGNYTWMLLDKELMEEFVYAEDSINALSYTDENLFRFLDDVKKDHPEIIPIQGTTDPLNIYHWTVDPETNRLTNEFSIVGSSYKNDSGIGYEMLVTSIFHIPEFTNHHLVIKRLEEGGYYNAATPAAEGEEARVAVKIVEGGYDVYAENSDKYFVKMLAAPRADVEDIFQHMFCVNALEENVARSMEIITYINTNEEVRNILQYGVKDENYYIDEEGVLHRYNDTYMMDVNKTGNIFMAHPEEGLPENYWEYGIQQNEDAMIVPTYSMLLGDETNVDLKSLANLQALSAEYMERMNNCATLADLQTFFATARSELNSNEDFTFVRESNYVPENEGELIPISTFYWNWLVDNGYAELETED